MSRTVQVTFDCADPNALAGFWNEVLGYRYDSPPPGFATWEEALDHFGVPEEDRNNASASVDPEETGPAAVLPEGARGQDRQEPAPPRRPGRARAPGRRADGRPRGRVRPARGARRRAGCSATSPSRR